MLKKTIRALGVVASTTKSFNHNSILAVVNFTTQKMYSTFYHRWMNIYDENSTRQFKGAEWWTEVVNLRTEVANLNCVCSFRFQNI